MNPGEPGMGFTESITGFAESSIQARESSLENISGYF
jgi:hypothetical protein